MYLVNKSLLDDYFEWLCQKLEPAFKWRNYSKLLRRLLEIDFVWTLDMDKNRALKGVYLRDAYGVDNSFSEVFITNEIDISPCSVLEMMIALAKDCEDQIMWDEDIGDRTGVWFYHMIRNLGLLTMDDKHYNRKFIDVTIRRMMYRTYAPNGKGSMFYTVRPDVNMQEIDIWYQMMYWLDAFIQY